MHKLTTTNGVAELEALHNLSGWDISVLRLNPVKRVEEAVHYAHENFKVCRTHFTSNTHVTGCLNPDMLGVLLPVCSGRMPGWHGRTVRNRELLLLGNAGDGVDLVTRSEMQLFSIAIDPNVLRQAAKRTRSGVQTNLQLLPSSITLSEARYDALQACLNELLSSGDSLIPTPGIEAELLNLICGMLTTANRANGHKRAMNMPDPSHLVTLSRNYIKTNARDQIRLSNICEAAKTPPWTLLRAFKDVYGVSPMRYVKALRLDRARRALITNKQTSVTEEALGNGFTHLSRFSRSYREQFGELPSETFKP